MAPNFDCFTNLSLTQALFQVGRVTLIASIASQQIQSRIFMFNNLKSENIEISLQESFVIPVN